jgi:polyphosphate kinase 2 (PPK2 family)
MSILSQVNLNQALTREQYEEQLIRFQVALSQLAYQVYVQKRPVAIVFEGWDAAGKGGAIKRLTERLDPRGYVVYPIAAPAGEDKTHHYLYRFWRRLPERGQIAVFDRSWYGRVMVERIEGFCTEAEWKRAYREINQFERQLVDFGAVIFKFWVHISKDEQLRRFRERENTPYKAWKLTAEDWRNREKWDLYETAVEEMLLKTSTVTAPWTIVEGTDKAWARVKVLKTVVDMLSRELDFVPDILSVAPEKSKQKPAKDKSGTAKGRPAAGAATDPANSETGSEKSKKTKR